LVHFATQTIELSLGPPCINQQSVAGGDRSPAIDNCARGVDTRTASDSEESDNYDMDDFFDVSDDLIAESADLSQYRDDRLLQLDINPTTINPIIINPITINPTIN
jgi:hypothetical protein